MGVVSHLSAMVHDPSKGYRCGGLLKEYLRLRNSLNTAYLQSILGGLSSIEEVRGKIKRRREPSRTSPRPFGRHIRGTIPCWGSCTSSSPRNPRTTSQNSTRSYPIRPPRPGYTVPSCRSIREIGGITVHSL